MRPITSAVAPAALLGRADEAAAVRPDDTDEAALPDEAGRLLAPAADDMEDIEAIEVMDAEEAEAAPEDEAPSAELALAARLERGGSEMELVAEPRLTDTEPEVTTTAPQRACWSWTEVCCSAAVQLLPCQYIPVPAQCHPFIAEGSFRRNLRSMGWKILRWIIGHTPEDTLQRHSGSWRWCIHKRRQCYMSVWKTRQHHDSSCTFLAVPIFEHVDLRARNVRLLTS